MCVEGGFGTVGEGQGQSFSRWGLSLRGNRKFSLEGTGERRSANSIQGGGKRRGDQKLKEGKRKSEQLLGNQKGCEVDALRENGPKSFTDKSHKTREGKRRCRRKKENF